MNQIILFVGLCILYENDSFDVTIYPRWFPIIAKNVLIRSDVVYNTCDVFILNENLIPYVIFEAPIPQNGQTHSNNLSAVAGELFEYV